MGQCCRLPKTCLRASRGFRVAAVQVARPESHRSPAKRPSRVHVSGVRRSWAIAIEGRCRPAEDRFDAIGAMRRTGEHKPIAKNHKRNWPISQRPDGLPFIDSWLAIARAVFVVVFGQRVHARPGAERPHRDRYTSSSSRWMATDMHRFLPRGNVTRTGERRWKRMERGGLPWKGSGLREGHVSIQMDETWE